jgi:hypothetical protein
MGSLSLNPLMDLPPTYTFTPVLILQLLFPLLYPLLQTTGTFESSSLHQYLK